jgi:hypothetical protein
LAELHWELRGLYWRCTSHSNSSLPGSVGQQMIWWMLRDDEATPEQIAIFRSMTGEQRLRLAEQLYWSARKMKAAGLRSQHPDWTEEQVQREVTRIFLHARS